MMKNIFSLYILLFMVFFGLISCNNAEKETNKTETSSIPKVILDTDANNELDDQHALAYLFFNSDVLKTLGVTVNATKNGGDIHLHKEEASRVMKLCTVDGKIPLLSGANGSFKDIQNQLTDSRFDGHEAVNFIVEQARLIKEQKLVLIPVGKLTNIALALKLAPDIKEKIRIVWLGSNYPKSGEYNLDNDILAMNYVLEQEVPFEMVMVRYGEPSGSDAVKVTAAMINEKMNGRGPLAGKPVEGRHHDSFQRFGDYSMNLFQNIDLYGNPPARSLFDVVAVAIIKNPKWGSSYELAAPKMKGTEWVLQPENKRKIIIWENFQKDSIINDFFGRMENYRLPE